MFLRSTRYIILIFGVFLLLISAIRFLASQSDTSQNIELFFTQSSGCEAISPPCFIGIIPDESDQDLIYDRLHSSPYIADFGMAQVEFGIRQMFLEWNGQQPDFIQGDAHIRLLGEQVRSIEIETTLTLGDVWLTFGKTDFITVTPFTLWLYYQEVELYIQSTLNCDAFWYSPVTISIYGSTSNDPTPSHTIDTAIAEYCRNR